MKDKLKEMKEEVEIAGSLTPELRAGGRSQPHPFRYAGRDPEGAPPRGVEQK